MFLFESESSLQKSRCHKSGLEFWCLIHFLQLPEKVKKKSAQTQDAGTTHRPVSVNADHFLGIFANWKDSHFYVLPCRGRRNSRHKRQVQDLQFHKRQKSDYFQAVRSECETLIFQTSPAETGFITYCMHSKCDAVFVVLSGLKVEEWKMYFLKTCLVPVRVLEKCERGKQKRNKPDVWLRAGFFFSTCPSEKIVQI